MTENISDPPLRMTLPFFAALGSYIEERWHAASFDTDALPDIAVDALRDHAPHRSITGIEILRWLLDSRTLPDQFDRKLAFGQPPITVHRGREFLVDVYFWRQFIPTLHNHGFAGAFCVLEGKSLHAVFDFEVQDRVNERFLLGELHPKRNEILGPGDVQPFSRQKKLIHRLMHCALPSVSIVVRTSAPTRDYFGYAPPRIAYDHDFHDPVLPRHVEALLTLGLTDNPEFESLLDRYIARADLETAFRVLRPIAPRLEPEVIDRILSIIRERHGARADALGAAFQHQQQVDEMMDMRLQTEDLPTRMTLSILLVAQSRAEVLRLLQETFPDRDPVVTLIDALAQIKSLVTDDSCPSLFPVAPDAASWEALVQQLEGADRSSPALQRSPLLAPLFR